MRRRSLAGASRQVLSRSGRTARAARAISHGALVVAVCLVSARGTRATDGILSIRLTSALSTRHAKPGDRVDAVTIAPLIGDDGPIVPSGCRVSGRVTDVGARGGLAPSAWINLTFDTIIDAAGQAHPAMLRVAEVDNVRETVTDGGRVTAFGGMSLVPSRTGSLFMLAAYGHPIVLAAFEAAQFVMRGFRRPHISYDAGTELTITPMQPIPDTGTLSCDGPIAPVRTPSADLLSMIDDLPWRTQTGNPPRPADVINLLFVADGAALDEAFREARWTKADPLSLVAALKVVAATVEGHRYRRAPVSRLTLEGARPQLVFEKQNETLAKRHHARLWPTSVSLAGRPLWLAAATHDVAVGLSRQPKLFTHRIDPNIDDERLKVLNDLTFAGAVEAVAWVPRPDVATRGVNADGGSIATDGRLAIVWLTSRSAR